MKDYIGVHQPLQDRRSIQAYESLPEERLGETLLLKQKRANAINNRKLMKATNIEDLVKIDITSAGTQHGKLFDNDELNAVATATTQNDLKFDPLNFKQQCPQLNDREFLRNAAILHNSSIQTKSRKLPRSVGLVRRSQRTDKGNRLNDDITDEFEQWKKLNFPQPLTKESVEQEATVEESLLEPSIPDNASSFVDIRRPKLISTDFTKKEDQQNAQTKDERLNTNGTDGTNKYEQLKKDKNPIVQLQTLFASRKTRQRRVGVSQINDKYSRISKMEQQSMKDCDMSTLSYKISRNNTNTRNSTAVTQSLDMGGKLQLNQAITSKTRAGRNERRYMTSTGNHQKPNMNFQEHPCTAPQNSSRVNLTQKLHNEQPNFSFQTSHIDALLQDARVKLAKSIDKASAFQDPQIKSDEFIQEGTSNNFTKENSRQESDDLVKMGEPNLVSQSVEAKNLQRKLVGIQKLLDDQDLQDKKDRVITRQKLEQTAQSIQWWDLQDHKIAYEDAVVRGRQALDENAQIALPYKPVDPGMSRKFKDPKPTDFKPINIVYEGDRMQIPQLPDAVPERERRDHIVQQILQLHVGTFSQDRSLINDPKNYKYKASTLYNIQPKSDRHPVIQVLTGESTTEQATDILRAAKKSNEVSIKATTQQSLAQDTVQHTLELGNIQYDDPQMAEFPASNAHSNQDFRQTVRGSLLNSQNESSQGELSENRLANVYAEAQQAQQEIQNRNIEFHTQIGSGVIPQNQEITAEDVRGKLGQNLFGFIKTYQNAQRFEDRNFDIQVKRSLQKLDKQTFFLEKQRLKEKQNDIQNDHLRISIEENKKRKEIQKENKKNASRNLFPKRRVTPIDKEKGRFNIDQLIEDAQRQADFEENETLKGSQITGIGQIDDALKNTQIGDKIKEHRGKTEAMHSSQKAMEQPENRDLHNLHINSKTESQMHAQQMKPPSTMYKEEVHSNAQKRIPLGQNINSNENLSHYESGDTIGINKTAKSPASPLTHFKRDHSAASNNSTVMSLALETVNKKQDHPVISAERIIEQNTNTLLSSDVDPVSTLQPAQGTIRVVTENQSLNPVDQSVGPAFPGMDSVSSGKGSYTGIKKFGETANVTISREVQMRSLMPEFRKDMPEASPECDQPASHVNRASFKPRRFNRHPRFFLYSKDERYLSHDMSQNQNCVNLSPEFLGVLMENKELSYQFQNAPQHMRMASSDVQSVMENESVPSNEPKSNNYASSIIVGEQGQMLVDSKKKDKRVYSKNSSAYIESSMPTAHMTMQNNHTKSPKQRWVNATMKECSFDPFENVVLVKGIDNSILTSYRTLKGQNNTVSDDCQIIHKKFQQESLARTSFYKQMAQNRVKNQLYNVNKNASSADFENPLESFREESKNTPWEQKLTEPDEQTLKETRPEETKNSAETFVEITNENTQSRKKIYLHHPPSVEFPNLNVQLPTQEREAEGEIDCVVTDRDGESTVMFQGTGASQKLISPQKMSNIQRKIKRSSPRQKHPGTTTSITPGLQIVPPTNILNSDMIVQGSLETSSPLSQQMNKKATIQWPGMGPEQPKSSPPLTPRQKVLKTGQSQHLDSHSPPGGSIIYETIREDTAKNTFDITPSRQEVTLAPIESPNKPNFTIQNTRKEEQNEGPRYQQINQKIVEISKTAYQQASISSGRKDSQGSPRTLQPIMQPNQENDLVIGPSGGYMPTKAFLITSKQRNPYKPNALKQKAEEQDSLGIKGTRKSKSREGAARTKSPATSQIRTGRTSQEDVKRASKIKVISNDSKMQQTETQQTLIAQGSSPANKAQISNKDLDGAALHIQTDAVIPRSDSHGENPSIEQYQTLRNDGTPLLNKQRSSDKKTFGQHKRAKSNESDIIDVNMEQRSVSILKHDSLKQSVISEEQQHNHSVMPAKLEDSRNEAATNYISVSRDQVNPLDQFQKSPQLPFGYSKRVSNRENRFSKNMLPKSMQSSTSPHQMSVSPHETATKNFLNSVVSKISNNKGSLRGMIDEFYVKDRAYVANTDKDNFLNYRSPIFDLQTYHNLKPNEIITDSVEGDAKKKSSTKIGPAPIKSPRGQVLQKGLVSPFAGDGGNVDTHVSQIISRQVQISKQTQEQVTANMSPTGSKSNWYNANNSRKNSPKKLQPPAPDQTLEFEFEDHIQGQKISSPTNNGTKESHITAAKVETSFSEDKPSQMKPLRLGSITTNQKQSEIEEIPKSDCTKRIVTVSKHVGSSHQSNAKMETQQRQSSDTMFN